MFLLYLFCRDSGANPLVAPPRKRGRRRLRWSIWLGRARHGIRLVAGGRGSRTGRAHACSPALRAGAAPDSFQGQPHELHWEPRARWFSSHGQTRCQLIGNESAPWQPSTTNNQNTSYNGGYTYQPFELSWQRVLRFDTTSTAEFVSRSIWLPTPTLRFVSWKNKG